MSIAFSDFIIIFSIIINLIVLIIQSKIKTEIAVLRVEMYERFVTKSEARLYFRSQNNETGK